MLRRIAVVITLLAGALATRTVLSARSDWIALCRTSPRIATIDYYGLDHITAAQLRAKLKLKEGDVMRIARPLAGVESRQSVEARLLQIPGVLAASVISVQSDDPHHAAFFVGIAETNASGFGSQPTGGAVLPGSVADLYSEHSEAFYAAFADPAPDFDEDDSQGHAIFTDPKKRTLEEKAMAFDSSDQNLNTARVVLHTSANTSQRRAAAWLLSYAPNKRTVVDDLTGALRDSDPDLRNIVTRALALIADYANRNPGLNIHIEPGRFIEMLSSLSWLDRDKAMAVLNALTETREEAVLTQLRQRGLPALDEMARWKSSYAEDAFKLIGRVAGLSDAEVETSWSQGAAARDQVIRIAGSARQ